VPSDIGIFHDLPDAPEYDLVDLARFDACPLDRCLDDGCTKVRRGRVGESALKATDRSPDPANDDYFFHRYTSVSICGPTV
jgi:hypothetical protein